MARPVLRLGIGVISTALVPVLAPACVVPVAPEFEDPPAAINYAPFIEATDKPFFTVQTAPAEGDWTFEVNVADPNIGDTLYVRWIFNYPPRNADVTRMVDPPKIPPSAGGNPDRGSITLLVSCKRHNLPNSLKQHRLMVAISDRPFVDDENSPYFDKDASHTSVPPEARLVTAGWYLNLECKP